MYGINCYEIKYHRNWGLRMLVFQSTIFSEHVEEYGLEDRADDLIKKIESCDSYFDIGMLFSGAYPYLKKRIGKYRIIGRVETLDHRQVFVCCNVFERKDPKYMEFMQDRTGRGRVIAEPGFDEDTFRIWMRSQKSEVKKIADLPSEMVGWLEQLDELNIGATREEFVLHDSEMWVDSVKKNFINTGRGLAVLYQPVLEILDEAQGDIEVDVVQVKSISNVQIIWAKHSATEICLLRAMLQKPTEVQIAECQSVLQSENYRNLIQHAYLAVIVYEEELWLQVQKEDNANLLLSEEEGEILSRMSQRPPVGSDPYLPTVISGRAGSGKSTMLAYVFAALCLRKANKGLDGKPIYISYSPRLLETAKSVIKALLSANSQFLDRTADREAITVILNEIDSYFFRFSDFLLEFIPIDQRYRFEPSSHVNFNDFKRAFLRQNSDLPPFSDHTLRNVSPERAWYAIRQFIKGSLSEIGDVASWTNDAEEELEMSFNELSRGDRGGLDTAQLVEIFKKVYLAWYRPALLEKRLWDDQDLVTEALKNSDDSSLIEKRFTAIVCDEAQDFTPREIRFIVRASSLLRYDLHDRNYLSLPFVLAGDSLQTLSPTGFRWGTVTSILYEEIFSVTSKEVRTNRAPLKQNYRSAKRIVNFSNLIQLWRKHLFPSVSKEIEPQIAWKNSNNPRPQQFVIGQNLEIGHLKEALGDHIVIVPCEENGEVDYVKNDEILSALYPDVSDDHPPATVLSASSAKGLEFPHVFLYKFEDHFRKEGFSLVKPDNDFALEYFFNKFYVACTRAKESLTIIEDGRLSESSDYEDGLWVQLVLDGETRPERAVELEERFPDFIGLTEYLEFGSPESWRETNTADPRVMALEMSKQAHIERNYQLMSRACELFKRAGDHDRAKECKAYEYSFNGKPDLAAIEFEALKREGEAWDILFANCLWTQAQSLSQRYVGSTALERELVRFMTSSETDSDSLANFVLSLFLEIEHGEIIKISRPWSLAQQEIKNRADRDKFWSDFSDERLFEVATAFSGLVRNQFSSLREVEGSIWYELKHWQHALDAWELVRGELSDRRKKYKVLARAQLTGFPLALVDLFTEGLHKDVINIWSEKGKPRSSDWLEFVAPSFSRGSEHQESLNCWLDLGNTTEAIKSYRNLKANQSTEASKYVERLVKLCIVEFRFFDQIENLLEDRKYSDLSSHSLLETFFVAAVELWVAKGFVQERAVLDDLGFQDAQRRSLLKCLEKYQPSIGQRRIDPRWNGFAWELTGEFERCKSFYKGFIFQDTERAVQIFARKGYLRSLVRERNYNAGEGGAVFSQSAVLALDKEIRRLRCDWRLPIGSEAKQQRDLEMVPKYLEPSNEEGFSESGDFSDFSWSLNRSDIILIHKGESTLLWRIETSHNRCTSLEGLIDPSGDGCFRFAVNSWKVEIRIGQVETKIKFEEDGPSGINKVVRFDLGKVR